MVILEAVVNGTVELYCVERSVFNSMLLPFL